MSVLSYRHHHPVDSPHARNNHGLPVSGPFVHRLQARLINPLPPQWRHPAILFRVRSRLGRAFGSATGLGLPLHTGHVCHSKPLEQPWNAGRGVRTTFGTAGIDMPALELSTFMASGSFRKGQDDGSRRGSREGYALWYICISPDSLAALMVGFIVPRGEAVHHHPLSLAISCTAVVWRRLLASLFLAQLDGSSLSCCCAHLTSGAPRCRAITARSHSLASGGWWAAEAQSGTCQEQRHTPVAAQGPLSRQIAVVRSQLADARRQGADHQSAHCKTWPDVAAHNVAMTRMQRRLRQLSSILFGLAATAGLAL